MKHNMIYAVLSAVLFFSCSAVRTPVVNKKATDSEGREMLLGHCSVSCLKDSPYKMWFDTSYANYTVDSKTANEMKPFLHDKTIVVFMGT